MGHTRLYVQLLIKSSLAMLLISWDITQIESALFFHIFSVQRYEGPDDKASISKDGSQLGHFLILN